VGNILATISTGISRFFEYAFLSMRLRSYQNMKFF